MPTPLAYLEPRSLNERDTTGGWPRLNLWITVGIALALGLVLVYEGTHLGFFHGKNEIGDGVYYGEGVMLSHGILPYRSYLDVQPPGMSLLTAPFGFLGRLTSHRVGFEWARAFVVVVAVANIVLLGRLVRRRHWVGVLTGLAVLGFYLDSLVADHTILLEPFLVLGTLIAFLFVFADTEAATSVASRRLMAGVVLGLTTSVKLWAAFPFIVLLVFAAKRGRRSLVHYVGGAIAGLLIVCLPFFVFAPSKFFREVVVVQVTRSHAGYAAVKVRLLNLLGVSGNSTSAKPLWVSALFWLIVGAVVVASIWYGRRASGGSGGDESRRLRHGVPGRCRGVVPRRTRVRRPPWRLSGTLLGPCPQRDGRATSASGQAADDRRHHSRGGGLPRHLHPSRQPLSERAPSRGGARSNVLSDRVCHQSGLFPPPSG